MGSNTTNTTQQTSGQSTANQVASSQVTKDPYGPTLPYINDLAQSAQNYAGAAPAAAAQFEGYVQAPFWQAYHQSQDPTGMTYDTQQPMNALGGISTGQNSINTGNLYQHLFDQSQDPGSPLGTLAGNTSGAMTPTQQAILDQNAERIGNRQASLYSGAGRYGSFGAGIGMARGISETNNPLIAQFSQSAIQNALAANQQRSQNAMGAAGGLSSVQQQNIGNRMNAAGMQLNAVDQGVKRAQTWNQMVPGAYNLALSPYQQQWQDMQNRAGVLGSMAPYLANAGTVTSNSNQNMTGTQSGTQTGQTSQPTPWTTYAGLGIAGIGAGSGLFSGGGLSDRRMKTDITKLGKDPHTSLNMYAFRYKGDPKHYPKMVGPMAQEVQKKYPEAVGSIGGILYIKAA